MELNSSPLSFPGQRKTCPEFRPGVASYDGACLLEDQRATLHFGSPVMRPLKIHWQGSEGKKVTQVRINQNVVVLWNNVSAAWCMREKSLPRHLRTRLQLMLKISQAQTILT